jgi:hypothetical protein
MMGNKHSAAASAWSSSPVDDCLDRLGVCEEEVTECRFRVEALEAANVLLQHPVILIGLAVALAGLAALEVVRQLWHVGAGNVPGAFPVDRALGWCLRRVGRALRPIFCASVERAAGPEAAAAAGELLDPFLASPPSASSTPAAPLPAAVVSGRPRLATPSTSRCARSMPPTPPAPPPSVATVWESARSAPPPRSRRSARSVERSAFNLALAARRLEAGPPSLQMELDALNLPYENVRFTLRFNFKVFDRI